ncbi:MAG TPA: hypothetical protein VGS19_06865 [Streptosporangiaceae bacterium]|nr:hypothetical protein [Streptosporangiaceae bacterium]
MANVFPDNAARLGRLLAEQWQVRGGTSAAVSPLRGVKYIALAPPPGAPPLPAPLPAPPMMTRAGQGLHFHTLTLHFFNRIGGLGAAIVWVQNVEDARLTYFVNGAFPAPGVRGCGPTGCHLKPMAFSVPEGTYSIMADIITPQSSGHGWDATLMAKLHVPVRSNLSATLDARAAKPYDPTISPHVAISQRADSIDLIRTSVRGGSVNGTGAELGLQRLPGVPGAGQLFVVPTPSVAEGALYFDATSVLYTAQSNSGAPTPRYYLDFAHMGNIPAQSYLVPRSQLTAVDQKSYGSPWQSCGNGPWYMVPLIYHVLVNHTLQISPDVGGDVFPLGSHTEYWFASEPRLDRWVVFTYSAYGCAAAYRMATPLTIRPGEHLTQTWNKAPLVPSEVAPSGYSFSNFTSVTSSGPWNYPMTTSVCPACRQDDNAFLYLLPFGDSDPSHFSNNGLPGPPTGLMSGLRFYRNGTLALSSSGIPGGQLEPYGVDLPMLPQAAVYRLVWTQPIPQAQPAASTTDWTFRSVPSDRTARLPATEQCAPDATRSCSFLQLLFVRYNLALNIHGEARAGSPFRVAFTVAHQENEPAPRRVTATVSASFDDGKTWTAPRSATSTGPDRFALIISQPPLSHSSGFVSLRVTARDGAGNSVTQTTIRAYGLIG